MQASGSKTARGRVAALLLVGLALPYGNLGLCRTVDHHSGPAGAHATPQMAVMGGAAIAPPEASKPACHDLAQCGLVTSAINAPSGSIALFQPDHAQRSVAIREGRASVSRPPLTPPPRA